MFRSNFLRSPGLCLAFILLTSRSSGYGYGKIYLGGLFPIHEASQEFKCSHDINLYGFQALHAMLYAIDKVNKDDSLLRNITLKGAIFDTCGNPTTTAGKTREIVKMKILKDSGMPLVGVVGAAISDISAKVANILQVFEIPQISYASTSVLLSNKDDYSYFLRTVPADSYQARAMVDICLEFGWSYVMTVNSEGIYGTNGIQEFIKHAQGEGICTDHIASMKPSSNENVYENVVESIVERSRGTRGTVVVLFCTTKDSTGIIRAAQRHKGTSKFVWLASDSWLTTITDLVNTSILAIDIIKGKTSPDFLDYFESLNINKLQWKNDVYLKEFWQQTFHCDLTNSSALPKCTGNESLRELPFPVSQFHTVINAVNAFAQSIDEHQKEQCRGIDGMCEKMETGLGGSHFMEHLRNESFSDSMNATMRFNEDGEVEAQYAILNYQEGNKETKYVQIGTWKAGRIKNGGRNLELDLPNIQWHIPTGAPRSYCSAVCPFGTVQQLRPGYNSTCCWICQVCNELQVIINSTCLDGPVGYVPALNRTTWVKREVLYLHWDGEIPVFMLTVSGIGICLTLFTFGIYIAFHDNRIVKASGREASYIILTGILLCLINPFLYIARPTDPVCYARKLFFGLSLAIVYSALFMKLNRIYRIFQSAKRSARRPAFIRPKSQVLVTLGLISIHILFISLWFVIEPTHAMEYYHTDMEEIHLECNTKRFNFVGSHSYVTILEVLCTIYAFKTRKVPKNFNESKYIAVTLYTTCVISTLFLAFFLNADEKIAENLLIAGASIVWGYITLVGLFAQRIYIILFVGGVTMDSENENDAANTHELAKQRDNEILHINFKRKGKVSDAVNGKEVRIKAFKKRSMSL